MILLRRVNEIRLSPPKLLIFLSIAKGMGSANSMPFIISKTMRFHLFFVFKVHFLRCISDYENLNLYIYDEIDYNIGIIVRKGKVRI